MKVILFLLFFSQYIYSYDCNIEGYWKGDKITLSCDCIIKTNITGSNNFNIHVFGSNNCNNDNCQVLESYYNGQCSNNTIIMQYNNCIIYGYVSDDSMVLSTAKDKSCSYIDTFYLTRS